MTTATAARRMIRWAWVLALLFSFQIASAVSGGSTTKSSPEATIKTSDDLHLDVVVLTSTNFDRMVGDGNVWLIEFYAPWCTHCMSFASTYAEIARHFHSNPKLKVRVGKVDTTQQRALGQRFSVHAYPSFFVVHGSSVYEFEGSRSKGTLIQYATKGYKEQPSIPFYSSPMGPVGRLQGLLIWSGVSLMSFFSWVQETSGLSPLLAGCLLAVLGVFGSMFSMIFLVIILTPREKVD